MGVKLLTSVSSDIEFLTLFDTADEYNSSEVDILKFVCLAVKYNHVMNYKVFFF